MKNIVFIIVFILLVKPVLPVLDYVVNYEYISKVLCINKDKPMMHCNGKCHLMQELAKASKSEKGTDKINLFSLENNVLFCQEIVSPISYILYKPYQEKTFSLYKIIYNFSLSNLVFRPPLPN